MAVPPVDMLAKFRDSRRLDVGCSHLLEYLNDIRNHEVPHKVWVGVPVEGYSGTWVPVYVVVVWVEVDEVAEGRYRWTGDANAKADKSG